MSKSGFKRCLLRARPVAIAMVTWFVASACALAQQSQSDDSPPQAALPTDQQRLAEKYDRLELLAGRLAELSRATQPRRAKLLRELVAKSRERDVPGQFEAIIAALQNDQLAAAVEGQSELQVELQQLLDLLLQEDRDRQIEAERKRIAKYLADLKRIIRLQRGIKARTEGGDDQDQLTENQQRTADATGKLSDKIKETEGSRKPSDAKRADAQAESKPSDDKPSDSKSSEGKPDDRESSDNKPNEGKPSEGEPSDGKPSEGKPSEASQGEPSPGQPSEGSPGGSPSNGQSQEAEPQQPADRATERLQRAQKRMQRAIERLEQAKRDEAVEQQEQALRELEQAKAELERILRQLREEEMERMLVLLEARFRKMLNAQIAVYEQTKFLYDTQDHAKEHDLEIASGRLSRKEKLIVHDADRALILMREDGTSVAFPEAVEQAREDMQAVADRLSEVKLGEITQALEEDVIVALEEALAALQQAIKELRKQRSSQQRPAGEPGEQPLVDQLAELRMIRALQVRINRRTKRYGELIEGQQALEAELLEALDHLADREERVFRATRDLHQGANR